MKVASKSGANNIDDEISEVKFDLGMDDEDDDDDILIQDEDALFGEQMEENEMETEVDLEGVDFDEEMEDEEAANISVGVSNSLGDHRDSGSSGFDFSTGKLWIYPTNYPVRDYQYNIVQQTMFKNTLVVLPTGLGKTFIAAVLMYNFFRWFPQGKVVFMAPTKPLVAQQIQACYNIMGIPKDDTVEMTGTMSPSLRQKAWREKRVVFLTPQVMTNDLSRGSVTAESIKCLVLDEAHKALGNHAYCQVVRELIKFTREFRVLALSATPGSDLKAVQQMMNNLLISHIELRSEESIDIRAYTHERRIDKIVVPMGEELSGVRLKYIQVMTCVVQRLIRSQVLYNREATKLSKFLLLKARDEFRQNPPQNLQQVQYGNIEADFAMAISLYHGFELLQLHGLRSLYNYLTGIIVGEKGYGRTRSELLRNADFNEIMENLRQKFTGANSHGVSSESGDIKVVVGHPKMQRLEEIVVDHFKSFEKNGEATRVMIFSQYRDSVQEIATILNQHQPLIKVMPFIGQSSAGKTTKGYTQKEQLMVMRQFREGGYNTLVSTCVGEEGLDIGDVDLIVCFDAHKSPIRLVQRMGRTGRKRKGRIVMLVTEGKEEQIYNQSLYSKKSIHKAILNGAKSLHFYPDNPRMLPATVTPQCHKMHITLAAASKKAKTPSKSRRALSSKNKTISEAFGKQVKRVFEDECLTAEEYEEIKKEFSELPSAGKQLSKPRCVILEPDAQHDLMEAKNSHMIDFSEWMPWQNRLQATHMIGHSVHTLNLVKTSEFMELQRCIGDEEDHYGVEMNRWLKENGPETRIQRSQGQSNMHYFFTNIQNKSNSVEKDKLHTRDGLRKKKIKSETRHKEQETINTIKDAILVGSDSSVDGGQERTLTNDHVKPKVSRLFTELGHSNDTSNVHSPNGKKNKSRRKKKAESNKTRKLSTKVAVENKTDVAKKKKVSGTDQDVTNNVRKTSLLKLLENSSCHIPSTKDSDDFEVDTLRSKRSGLDNEKVDCSKSEHVAVDNNITSLNTNLDLDVSVDDDQESQYLTPHAIELFDNQVQTHKIGEFQTSMRPGKETCSDSLGKVRFCITKPPPVSGVKELFQSLESGKEFRELDLEELMKQWNELGRDVCIIATSQQNMFMSAEKRQGLQFVAISQTTHKPSAHVHEEMNVKNSNSNQWTAQTNVDELFQSERQSITNTNSGTCKSADNIATENTPGSPVFKRLVNKTVHINKHVPVRLPNLFEKKVAPEYKQQADMCKADNKYSKFDDSFVKNCPQESQTAMKSGVKHCAQEAESVQHVLPFKKVENADKSKEVINTDIFKETMNTDIFIEENCDFLMTSFMDGEEMDMNSCKNTTVSPVVHESFVTFTQAMECLQTSSEENFTTPPSCRHSSRSKANLEQFNVHTNTPLEGDNRKSETKPSENTHHNLRISNQNIKHTAQNCIETHKTVPLAASFSVKSTTELPVIASKFSIQDSLVINLQSDNNSKQIGQNSKNQSASDLLTESPVAGCSTSNLELPHFDLGFDFDDDDDIIPPTPTKHLSQESMFGLKTFTMDKHSLQETRTLSLSDTDKALVSVSRLTSDILVASPPASALSAGTGDFEPFMSTFDLQLSSDDSQEMIREICAHDASERPEAGTRKEQKQQLFSNNQSELGSKPFHENQIVPPSEGNHSFHALLLNAESETKNSASLKLNLPSPPKKKKLPLNKCGNDSEKESRTASGGLISSPGDWTVSNKTPPNNSTNPNAGKLKLGKRHIEEVTKDSSVVTDNQVDEWQKYERPESFLQAACKSLSDIDDMDDYEGIFQDTSFDELGAEVVSPSNNSLNPVSVCKTPKAIAAVSCVQESPKVCARSANDVVVTASTPIRYAADSYARHSMVDAVKDINMPELTPIRARKDESKNYSDDGFVVRRKKHTKALDISSDQDTSGDTTSVNMGGITTARMTSLKQTEACKRKKVNKSLLESISYSFGEDDDMNDFKDSHKVRRESAQSSKKNTNQKKTKLGCVFIEKEAEVSGDDGSSDEQEDVDDFYESSFIDNNTVMTQTQGPDMRAVYLKSIKSPVLAKPASYCRMQYNSKRNNDDIFSQALPEGEGLSEYEKDSFCVSSGEEDIYTEEESQLPERRHKRSRKAKTGQLQKGKKRVQMISQTSSDEDKDKHIQMTQEFSIHPCKYGRKVLLSSSEDEGIRVKKDNSSLDNLTASTSDWEKSCKNFHKVKCGTDAVIERQSLTKITGACLQENVGHEKFSLNRQQVSYQLPDASNVGNFDLLGDADWSDFEVSESENWKGNSSNSGNRNTSDSALIKEKHETEKCHPERKFLSLKDTSYVSDDVSRVTPVVESSSCNSSKNDCDARIQYHNPFKNSTSSFANVANKQFCDNFTNVSKKPSCSKMRDFTKCSDSDNELMHQTGQSTKGNILTSASVSCSSSSKSVYYCDNRISLIPDADMLGASLSNLHSVKPSGDSKIRLPDVDMQDTSLSNLHSIKPPSLMTREERLRRQKEKQEIYRKKLQQVQQINNSVRSSVTSTSVASEVIPETSGVNIDISFESRDFTKSDGDSSSHDQFSPVFTKLLDVQRTRHQLQILVDSREISAAQEIISALRLKHGITVTARQLSSCDYILSNHLAADRVQWSSFSNSSCRSKLSSRLCEMQAMYERCVLIVEADRVKAGQEKSKRLIHRTKYLDATLSFLMQSKIKVYFTDNVDETTTLLADLCNVEDKKGRSISVPATLSGVKEEMFRFVLSMPRVTVPQALNLAHKFRSVIELMSSPAGVIQERGCMTMDSAQSFHQFLRHQFDIQMMPSSKS